MLAEEKALKRGGQCTADWLVAFCHISLLEIGILSMHSLPLWGNPGLKHFSMLF
jgi:hypothetical protein